MGVPAEKPQSARIALQEAVAQVPGTNLAECLNLVARRLPVAVSVETAGIRLRDEDGDGDLHLVAIEGVAPNDRLPLLFDTQTIAHARSIFVLGHRHSFGRALGVKWLYGEWLRKDAEPIGTIVVGSRTERRPNEKELDLLGSVAASLSERLRDVDRRAATLEAVSRQLARDCVYTAEEAPERIRNLLRPRELVILSLYVDGLSAHEIADLFVISTHTVRTHIKNAYRRLGVHSREEAEELIRAQRVLELV